ncbi:MAG: M14 family zinc carboxypeptidase [Myxococcota bacterium]
MRASFLLTAVLAGVAWLWSTVALASGFPDFDPDREQVLHGRVAPKDAAVPGEADILGPWTEADGQLTITEEDPRGNRFWVVKDGVANVADGLVRARLSPGKRLDAGVVFRVQAGIDLREMSGYELGFDLDTIRLYRWDRGKVLPIGPEVKVTRLQRAASLEVVIYLVGPQIIATVYDGTSLKRLASLAIHETTHTTGRAGFRAGKRADAMQFGLLSVMDSRKPAPAIKGSGRHGAVKRYGLDADPGTTPFGNTRFAFVPDAEAKALPRDLRRGIEARLPGPDGALEAIVFTDTVGLERMKRMGVTIRAVDSNVPWKVFDADYRAQADKDPVATRRGFRLDLSYKNPAMVEALLRGYQAKYPEISTLVELGRSHQGRPIWALKISDNPTADESEPSVLLNGAHHASELLSVEFPLDAAATLLEGYGRDRDVTRWVDGMEIFVVPMVNPDGNHMFLEQTRFASRKNARDTNLDGFHDPFEGVDLNRNYYFGWGDRGSSGVLASKYYRGPHPASEPETWAMVTLADRQRFASAISFHTVGSAIFVPYTVGATPPSPNAPMAIAREMAEAGLTQPNDKAIRVRRNGYPVAGSDQDWLLHAHGTAAYIVEGSHHNPPLDIRARAVEATRPIWREMLQRTHAGPRVSGHVRDAAGNPIEAVVHVAEVQRRAGEVWHARPSDGRFDRLLARPGRYTVEASAPGFAPTTVEVTVRKPVDVDITLERS